MVLDFFTVYEAIAMQTSINKMKIDLVLLFNIFFLSIIEGAYILYEVIAFNPHERAFLYSFHLKVPSVIFLNGVSNEAAVSMGVIVKQELVHMFETSLQNLNIQYNRVSQILPEHIFAQEKSESRKNISTDFYDWEEILNWIAKLKSNNASLKKIVIGKTYEKRDIFFLRIKGNKKNPTVFIVGGEDGMDWLSSAVIFNLVNELLRSINELKMLMENFNFYFLPILNPDGFVYSKKQDRFWSKNRRVLYTLSKCEDKSVPIGVNIARNWFLSKSSKMPEEECNAVYIGQRPLSEEENQSLSYALNSLADNMIAFINVRGFGQYITVPYAQPSEEPNNHNIVMEIMRSTCFKARKWHNTTFYLGSTSNYIYNFTGNMADWVKKKLNIPLVYTVYLEDIAGVFPLPHNIMSISTQFITILNESLFITKDIYGHLFNNENKITNNIFVLVITFLLQFLYYVI